MALLPGGLLGRFGRAAALVIRQCLAEEWDLSALGHGDQSKVEFVYQLDRPVFEVVMRLKEGADSAARFDSNLNVSVQPSEMRAFHLRLNWTP